MNKAKHNEMISNIIDSITVIKGTAELAIKVDHPKWTNRYLHEIIKEVDMITSLIKSTEKELHDWKTECYSSPVSSGNSSFPLRHIKIVYLGQN